MGNIALKSSANESVIAFNHLAILLTMLLSLYILLTAKIDQGEEGRAT